MKRFTASRRTFLLFATASFAGRTLAQTPGRVYVVAYWDSGQGAQGRRPILEEMLASHGFIVGKNTRMEYLSTDHDERHMIPQQARELVAKNPDVIYISTGVPGRVLEIMATVRELSKSIPFVFDNHLEESARKLVGDLRRPRGNITGVALSYVAFTEKRLEFIRELLPRAKRVAVISDYRLRVSDFFPSGLDSAARRVGLQIVHGDFAAHGGGPDITAAAGTAALDATLADIVRTRPDAFMAYGGFNAPQRVEQFQAFEAKHRIPYIGDGGGGGVIGFGMDYADHRHRAAWVVARILRGTKPEDIPVELTSRFVMTVDLKKAREIGLEIPYSILLRADRVIQ